MAPTHKQAAAKKIKNILDRLPKSQRTSLKTFASTFFARMHPQEVAMVDESHAAYVMQGVTDFIATRKPGRPKIRISSPDPRKAGFVHQRLIVEVLGDDMPFLVDSLTAEIKRQGFIIHETMHPILHVERDSKGKLKRLAEEEGKHTTRESLIVFVLSALPDGMMEAQLKGDLLGVLQYIRHAVVDWKPLLAQLDRVVEYVASLEKGVDLAERDEAVDFLTWLGHNNFVFLGYIEYDFYTKSGKEKLSIKSGSEKGIFRIDGSTLKYQGLASIPPEMRHFARKSQIIEITKSNHKSVVHRPVHMDYVAIKKLDDTGKVIGECRFVGLFTSLVYYQSADLIPYIRRKISYVIAQAGFEQASHNSKALRAVLEFFPRDELFQISNDDLYRISLGVMALEAKPRPQLFVRADQYSRFMSCLVYLPRDMFNTFVRKEIARILERAFDGSLTAFYTQMTESPLARVHMIIKTTPGEIPDYDLDKIQGEIDQIVSFWIDGLREALIEAYGEQVGERYFRMLHYAFPREYVNVTSHEEALIDFKKILASQQTGMPSVRLFPDSERYAHAKCQFRLKIYQVGAETTLSETIPILENMGCRVLDAHPYTIRPEWEDDNTAFVRQFELALKDELAVDIEMRRAHVEDVLARIWCGEMESDGYNALVLRAGLDWRAISMLRAYGKYLRQTGLSYNEGYMASALSAHPKLSAELVALFEARFAPDKGKARAKAIEKIQTRIREELTHVSNLAEDRIIRRFADVMMATLRTNYYQTDAEGNPAPYLSFKFDSLEVPELPLPRPFAEIFVYSRRMEGIHLRGGKVARGGLRWSDRPEDFRTEVLGLMKAQMVKNAVIVPVGSKGGFVVKHPPGEGGREAFQNEGIACYKQFLSGMLDITDNLDQGKVIPPQDVVRHDGDDPYLVVAADKGTATFSDIANSISEAYGFWLGDAFASGGSAGYDHKKMGITARGAWVSVRRHFTEMGRDIQKEDFTVIGIGDMGGDVFGNGMLLSKHIRLVAAFNHLHIFLDPNPDSAASFKERQRLFKMRRSTWMDYDSKLISAGGGVFARTEKRIGLSREIRQLLGVNREHAAPDELIQLILKAEADLLWNGGIGTYVKAESETHGEVGDSSNDSVRVNGHDLRVAVVGEGGNLGFTQKGRIEFARAGGRINTDAIDNSAGVDCSDHEVNIKIALTNAEREGRLSRTDRNKLLSKMTRNVAELVLRDNQLQNQALSLAQYQGTSLLEQQIQMMLALEEKGLLNRSVERLPQNRDLQQLRVEKQGFTRPELSVLLSYAKISLYNDIADSGFPDSGYLTDELIRYFPEAMQETYANDIRDHRLRREIIATVITNSMINRAGITFYHIVKEDTGRLGCDIARAYIVVRDAFGLRELWSQIEALDGKVDSGVQMEMFVEINHLIERKTVWFLRHFSDSLNIEEMMERFAPDIAIYRAHFLTFISPVIRKAYDKKIISLRERGVPKPLATSIASIEAMSSACSVVSASHSTGLSVQAVGKVYYEIGAKLELGWLRRKASEFSVDTHWDKVAIKNCISDLYDEQRRLSMAILCSCDSESMCVSLFESWCEKHHSQIERYLRMIEEIRSTDPADVSMLFVAIKMLRTLGTGQE